MKRFTAKSLRELAAAMEDEEEAGRRLSDGTMPAVGQRVVTVREVAERWGLGHAHDELVHEITRLLGDDGPVECGPTQFGRGMLRLAAEGSEVTCPHCLGWHEQCEKWRIDAVVFRETQFKVKELEARAAELEEQLSEARKNERRALASWLRTGGPSALRVDMDSSTALSLIADELEREGGR